MLVKKAHEQQLGSEKGAANIQIREYQYRKYQGPTVLFKSVRKSLKLPIYCKNRALLILKGAAL